MNKKPKLEEDEIEWTTEMMKSAKRFHQLPMSLQEKLKSRASRGPQIAPTKIQTSIRLSADVISTFKASGKGWQSKIDSVLQEYISQHPVL
jgi:uncharacterized protein (DUF4415 family)